MNVYKNIERNEWAALMERPLIQSENLADTVRGILDKVKNEKDAALREYAKRFDKVALEDLQVSEAEIAEAKTQVSDELKAAIHLAKANIETFHAAQGKEEAPVEVTTGVRCWRKSVAIQKVGLYIPGGTAPLFSTVLMLGVPATIAGCSELVLCTPCNSEGVVNPAVLYTAAMLGIKKIYKVGGAQAIAAMAYGTETIPQVYKIFGPGNQFVTKAKELVQQQGVAIDMPAGPSEVLVMADKSGNPEFIAADLLSQAEHGVDSQVILLSDDADIIEHSVAEVERQLAELPRRDIAAKALEYSRFVLLESMDECMEFSNEYAPEHLIIASENAGQYAAKVVNAGSVFLGNYSCESAGDYASGTNHTLPTNGYAKNYSGVSLDSFVKKITFQELTPEGIQTIGPAIEEMAAAEQLQAHKNAVTLRLKSLKK